MSLHDFTTLYFDKVKVGDMVVVTRKYGCPAYEFSRVKTITQTSFTTENGQRFTLRGLPWGSGSGYSMSGVARLVLDEAAVRAYTDEQNAIAAVEARRRQLSTWMSSSTNMRSLSAAQLEAIEAIVFPKTQKES